MSAIAATRSLQGKKFLGKHLPEAELEADVYGSDEATLEKL